MNMRILLMFEGIFSLDAIKIFFPDAYPKMTSSPALSTPIVKPTTFEFNCKVNFDPARTDVGFDVTWLFDGKPDPNVPKDHITGSARDSRIDQKYLVGHLGEAVRLLHVKYYP